MSPKNGERGNNTSKNRTTLRGSFAGLDQAIGKKNIPEHDPVANELIRIMNEVKEKLEFDLENATQQSADEHSLAIAKNNFATLQNYLTQTADNPSLVVENEDQLKRFLVAIQKESDALMQRIVPKDDRDSRGSVESASNTESGRVIESISAEDLLQQIEAGQFDAFRRFSDRKYKSLGIVIQDIHAVLRHAGIQGQNFKVTREQITVPLGNQVAQLYRELKTVQKTDTVKRREINSQINETYNRYLSLLKQTIEQKLARVSTVSQSADAKNTQSMPVAETKPANITPVEVASHTTFENHQKELADLKEEIARLTESRDNIKGMYNHNDPFLAARNVEMYDKKIASLTADAKKLEKELFPKKAFAPVIEEANAILKTINKFSLPAGITLEDELGARFVSIQADKNTLHELVEGFKKLKNNHSEITTLANEIDRTVTSLNKQFAEITALIAEEEERNTKTDSSESTVPATVVKSPVIASIPPTQVAVSTELPPDWKPTDVSVNFAFPPSGTNPEIPQPEVRVETIEKTVRVPRAGDRITLRKLSLRDGQSSVAAVGAELKGILHSEISVGECIFVSDQLTSSTSPVRAIRMEGGRLLVDTQTSTYEVVIDALPAAESAKPVPLNELPRAQVAVSTELPQDLEQTTSSVSTETEPIYQLFGWEIPEPGPGGRFGARAFREGLLFLKRHGRIPEEARAAVEQVLKITGYIGEKGLTTEDVEKIKAVLRDIDPHISAKSPLTFKSGTLYQELDAALAKRRQEAQQNNELPPSAWARVRRLSSLLTTSLLGAWVGLAPQPTARGEERLPAWATQGEVVHAGTATIAELPMFAENSPLPPSIRDVDQGAPIGAPPRIEATPVINSSEADLPAAERQPNEPIPSGNEPSVPPEVPSENQSEQIGSTPAIGASEPIMTAETPELVPNQAPIVTAETRAPRVIEPNIPIDGLDAASPHFVQPIGVGVPSSESPATDFVSSLDDQSTIPQESTSLPNYVGVVNGVPLIPQVFGYANMPTQSDERELGNDRTAPMIQRNTINGPTSPTRAENQLPLEPSGALDQSIQNESSNSLFEILRTNRRLLEVPVASTVSQAVEQAFDRGLFTSLLERDFASRSEFMRAYWQYDRLFNVYPELVKYFFEIESGNTGRVPAGALINITPLIEAINRGLTETDFQHMAQTLRDRGEQGGMIPPPLVQTTTLPEPTVVLPVIHKGEGVSRENASNRGKVANTSAMIITPDAVAQVRNTFNGGSEAFDGVFENFARSLFSKPEAGIFSSWFGIESGGSLFEHVRDSGMTIEQFNELMQSGPAGVRSYARTLKIPVADFVTLQETIKDLEQGGEVYITPQMSLYEVLQAGYVLRRVQAEQANSLSK
jgi:hypothetical protein